MQMLIPAVCLVTGVAAASHIANTLDRRSLQFMIPHLKVIPFLRKEGSSVCRVSCFPLPKVNEDVVGLAVI